MCVSVCWCPCLTGACTFTKYELVSGGGGGDPTMGKPGYQSAQAVHKFKKHYKFKCNINNLQNLGTIVCLIVGVGESGNSREGGGGILLNLEDEMVNWFYLLEHKLQHCTLRC